MALSINKRRALIPPSTEDTLNDLPTLVLVEALDLSHGDIVGDAIVDFLQFLSLADTPFALLSIDLSHNRLGDAGVIIFAQLLQANASKLPNLKMLDLVQNGIRDDGALALMHAVEQAVADGHLRQLTSVALHNNDISDSVLRSMDAAWREIALAKTLSWSRTKLPPEVLDSSGASGFADLLKEQTKLVKAERVAKIAAVLEPVSTFLKRVLWHHVASEREMFPKHLVLRVFPALREDAISNLPPLISASSHLHLPNGYIQRAEKYISASPELQRFMEMVEPERAKFYRRLLQLAAEDCDPGGFVVPMASRADIDAVTIDAVTAQLEALHSTIADAQEIVKGFNSVAQWPGDYISAALTQALGLKSTVKEETRAWGARSSTTKWAIEDSRFVEVVIDPKPIKLEQSQYQDNHHGRIRDPESGFVIVCELPW